MEGLIAFFWLLFGLLVRFGIPILVTLLVIFGLRKLDEIWQSSASSPSLALAIIQVENAGCWRTKNCSEDQRQKCEAYIHQEMPCWQIFRDSHGQLKEACLGCEVFKSAPVPVRTEYTNRIVVS